MKKIMMLILCVVLSAVFLSGCVAINFSLGSTGAVRGSGVPEKFTYNIGNYTEVRVELYCDIEYYCAPSDTVTLEIQPNLQQYITVEESGGVLTVRSTKNIMWSNDAPVLTVSTPVLNKLQLAGAGDFTAHDTITAERLSIRLDGASSSYADLDVDELSINMAGAGSFRLSGRADTADIQLSGAGTVDALQLQTKNATVSMAGVGTVKLSCSDSLRIDAAGVGNVDYKGSPSVDINRGGLVSVNKVG